MKIRLICNVFLIIGVTNNSFFNIILLINDQSNRKKSTSAIDPESFPKGTHKSGNVKIRQEVKSAGTELSALDIQEKLRISILENECVAAFKKTIHHAFGLFVQNVTNPAAS
ncbi:hypothetical protein D1872_209970 [compost metagenome]